MNAKESTHALQDASIPSGDFIYSPLEENHIRLVELNKYEPGSYQFLDASLDRLPFFAAISYRWNERSELIPNTIDDKPLLVRSNVADCLKNFAEHRNWPYLWIDSVCINQSDVQERAAQVNLMGRIYGMAGAVFIWLGVQTPELDAAFDVIESIDYEAEKIQHSVGDLPIPVASVSGKFKLKQIETRWHAPSGLPSPEEIDKNCRALQALARLDYWERTWIIQEVRLARVVFLVTGRRTCNWQRLKVAFDSLTQKMNQDTTQPQFTKMDSWTENGTLHIGLPEPVNSQTTEKRSKEDDKRPEVTRLLAVSTAMSRLLYADDSGEPWEPNEKKLALLSILHRYDYSKCSDVRDRIYALLSINGAGARYGLKANYSWTPEELLITTAAGMHYKRPAYPGNVRAMSDAEFLQGLMSITACDGQFLQWITSSCTKSESSGVTEFRYSDGSTLCLPRFCEHFFEEAPIRGICELGFAMRNKAAALKQLEIATGAQASTKVVAHFEDLVGQYAAWKRFMIDDPLSVPTTEIHDGKREASLHPKVFLKADGAIGIACPSARPYDRIYQSYCLFKQPPIRLVVRESADGLQVIARAYQSCPKVVIQALPERPPEMATKWEGDGAGDWLDLDLVTLLALSSPMPEIEKLFDT